MAAVIVRDPRLVDRRLRQEFSTNRQTLVEIIVVAVAARARCTADSPRSAGSYYAWAEATTRLRQKFRPHGWGKGNEEGIETVANHKRKLKIAILSTDEGTADVSRLPRNRTVKGPASERVVDLNNQYELFDTKEMGPVVESQYSMWYLCIYDDGRRVRAELSRPVEFAGGYVTRFSERIFLLQDGDWEKVVLTLPDAATTQHGDFRIDVRRK